VKTKVFIISPHLKQRVSYQTRSDKASLEEAIGLAEAIDLEIEGTRTLHLETLSPATLIGSGVVEELKPLFESLKIQLVIVDFPLSPIQQRNLERQWKVKVIDRTGLILEIFGARARTAEGRLQVELASLQYQRGRLVRA
jgi:GTP-binding protein HflX